MKSVKNKFTFCLSAVLYLVFNLKIYHDWISTLQSTLIHLLQTAPFVAGFSYLIISVLQYMGDGSKVPWENRFRIFFAVGIMSGLILAIWQYAGVDFEQYQPWQFFGKPSGSGQP